MFRSLFQLFKVAIVMVLILGGILLYYQRQSRLEFEEAEAHLVAHQETLADSARSLIKSWQEGLLEIRIQPSEVPEGLNVPHLRFAEISETHVNLLYTRTRM